MKEYKVKKSWWHIIFYILFGLIILIFGLLGLGFVMACFLDFEFFNVGGALICLGFSGYLLYLLVDKIRIIITEDTLSYKSTFENRDLKFDEIKGYKIITTYGEVIMSHIYIFPKDTSTKKQIKIIGYSYFENGEELRAWIESNFTKLEE